MEIGDHCGSLQEIINLTENLDCYEIYPHIEDYDDLGRYYIEELEVLNPSFFFVQISLSFDFSAGSVQSPAFTDAASFLTVSRDSFSPV